MNIVLSRGDWISIIRSITRISSLHGKLVLLKRLVAVLLKEKEEAKVVLCLRRGLSSWGQELMIMRGRMVYEEV